MNPFAVNLLNNPGGVAFSNNTNRFAVVAAGRRSGKTLRGKMKVINRAVGGPCADPRFIPRHPFTPRYAFCAPTHRQAKSIFWEDLKDATAGLRIAAPRETELMVKLAHGPELYVVGLDEPARIEGVSWDGFMIDEVDDMKPGFWSAHLRPCLSDRQGWAILSGVPEGFRQLYEFSLFAQTDPEWSFHAWKSSEVLPPHEIASAMRSMDAKTFRQEYEASFEATAGRVYYAFDRNENVRPCPPGVPLFAGMDFNVDPMSCVVFGEAGGQVWLLEVIEISGSNTEEMCRELRGRYGDRLVDIYPDPSGRSRKTSAPTGVSDHVILKQNGFKVHTRLTVSIRDGINAVNSMFCTAAGGRRMFVDPSCRRGIECLERHEYKKGTSQPADDEFEHVCDAVRYPIDYRYSLIARQPWTQN